MKFYPILLFLFFVPMLSFSQIEGEDEVYLEGQLIDPKFEGEDYIVAFQKYLHKEFDYSKVTKPGRMVFAFTINEKGEVKNLKVVEILDNESAMEIFRVMKKCPNWQLAMRNGKPISIEIKFPMIFKSR